MNNPNPFDKGCDIVLRQCMALQPKERVLIITDDLKFNIGQALYQKAKELGAESTLMVIPVSTVSGQEPPQSAAAAMLEADVIICPTEGSLTHTNARIHAVKNGARMATMPGITEDMFSAGPIMADYSEVERLTHSYVELLTKASVCRVVTDENCTLTIDLKGRNGVPSTGVYREGGKSGNLPSGEAYIAPIEDGANGTYCVNGSIVGVEGCLKSPIILTVEKGQIVAIDGKDAALVEQAIPNNPLSRTIGELGIGTNPMARLTGVILEDEKIYGSVHVAFGTNTSFGGVLKAPSHIDCVTLHPTVYLDDVLVIEKGKLLF